LPILFVEAGMSSMTVKPVGDALLVTFEENTRKVTLCIRQVEFPLLAEHYVRLHAHDETCPLCTAAWKATATATLAEELCQVPDATGKRRFMVNHLVIMYRSDLFGWIVRAPDGRQVWPVEGQAAGIYGATAWALYNGAQFGRREGQPDACSFGLGKVKADRDNGQAPEAAESGGEAA
jgi:hypothetical protein